VLTKFSYLIYHRYLLTSQPNFVELKKNSDGLNIFGLAEYTRKIENSAILRMNVNNCGYNTAEKTQTVGNAVNIADFLLVQLSLSRFTLIQAVGGRPPRYAPAQACKW